MYKGLKRGFTLIELLVVIAIIGILAAIVLVSLGNVRQRGANTGVGANLSGLRTAAELYAQTNNTYVGFCASTGTNGGANAIAAARSAAGVTTGINTTLATGGSNGVTTCHETASAWAVESPLASPNTQFWCVDSNGFSGTSTLTSLAASDTTCNTN